MDTFRQHHRFIYWTPRILCIAAILFVSLFSLDAFEAGKPLGEQIIGFLIHLIPSFILTGLLVLAWKYELIGGILFLAIGLIMSPIIFRHNYAMNQSVGLSLFIIATITFPFVLTGILFILNHTIRKKMSPS